MRARPATWDGAPLSAVLVFVVVAVAASQVDAVRDVAALWWGVGLLLLRVAAPLAAGHRRRRRAQQ
ncbi:hypothetical protein [Kineococcus sp. G2]|uniref:hypothetical protein n=1 Tax=Kineococcus sp. G2 TaxID=3127484 RepID=UPI00301D48C9